MRLLKYTAAKICRRGGMADASDSKSDGGNFVPVQVRPPAETKRHDFLTMVVSFLHKRTCVEAEKMVVPYMKDELSPTELEDFLDHIHTCENCREELEIHYMVDVGLKKLDEADGTYDIVGDLKRKVAESYRSLRHISMFQITTYAVSTLTGMALIVMILLQLRIWNTFGFL